MSKQHMVEWCKKLTVAHIRNKSIREGKCRHYFFGCFSIQFVSQVAVTICSGRHYLLTEIEWRISQIMMTTFAFLYVSYFLYDVAFLMFGHLYMNK